MEAMQSTGNELIGLWEKRVEVVRDASRALHAHSPTRVGDGGHPRGQRRPCPLLRRRPTRPDAPAWLRGLFFDPAQRRVLCREWEDLAWRARVGWHGRDLIHDAEGDGVQVDGVYTLTGSSSPGSVQGVKVDGESLKVQIWDTAG